MDYVIYNDSTGKITQFGRIDSQPTFEGAPEAPAPLVPSGHTRLTNESVDSDLTWYYPSGVKTARPLFSTVASWNKTTIDGDGVDAATFGSSLPNPTSASYRKGTTGPWSTETSVTSGTYSFTATESGTYYIRLSAFPYQDYEATITVTETLAEAQEAQWNLIKQQRAAAIASGFTYDTNDYQSDPVSVVNIIGIALAAKIKKDNNEAFSVDWTTADNSVVTLDEDGAIALGMACMSHVSAQYDTGVSLRTDIEAATTIPAVEAITWPAT